MALHLRYWGGHEGSGACGELELSRIVWVRSGARGEVGRYVSRLSVTCSCRLTGRVRARGAGPMLNFQATNSSTRRGAKSFLCRRVGHVKLRGIAGSRF